MLKQGRRKSDKNKFIFARKAFTDVKKNSFEPRGILALVKIKMFSNDIIKNTKKLNEFNSNKFNREWNFRNTIGFYI